MPTHEELTQLQKKQWSAAAPGWERRNDWVERTLGDLSNWMCDSVNLSKGQHALDVACGTGQPAIAVARRVAPGRVTAIDLSPDMVAATTRTAARDGVSNLDVKEMNAQALEFADATFDAATCRFGLMFCPDPVRAASEIHRVLKPGARFATAVWDVPAKNPFFTALMAVIMQFVPAPPPDPQAPGVFRLAPPGELERVLRAGGFSTVTTESKALTFAYPSREEYWQVQTDLAAPLKAAIASLPPADLARLKQTLLGSLGPFEHNGEIRIGAAPLCAVATK